VPTPLAVGGLIAVVLGLLTLTAQALRRWKANRA
jgi:hypothetical protein